VICRSCAWHMLRYS